MSAGHPAKTFQELGIVIRETSRDEQRLCCPQCGKGERDDTLCVNRVTGMFICHRCQWAGCASIGETRGPSRVVRLDDPVERDRRIKRLRSVWSATLPLSNAAADPVRYYLARRGLGNILLDPPATLRAHVGLPVFEPGRDVEYYPCMTALLCSAAGDGATVHATYLRPDGTKAPVRIQKRLLQVPTQGATRGGAIRLYQPMHGILGLAEGIENALSLRMMYGIPVWSTYCAHGLERVRLPHGLKEVWIGVDVDANGVGQKAAYILAARLSQWEAPPVVKLVYPDGEGPRDLNDELLNRQVH